MYVESTNNSKMMANEFLVLHNFSMCLARVSILVLKQILTRWGSMGSVDAINESTSFIP